MIRRDGCYLDVWINLVCCYFFFGMYFEVDIVCVKGKGFKVFV